MSGLYDFFDLSLEASATFFIKSMFTDLRKEKKNLNEYESHNKRDIVYNVN